MLNITLVMIGGSLGAMARSFFTDRLIRYSHFDTLYATIFINTIGAFFLGVIMMLFQKQMLYLLLGIGFFGGFTTFSTFQVEMALLYQKKFCKKAAAILIAASFIGFLAILLGMSTGIMIAK